MPTSQRIVVAAAAGVVTFAVSVDVVDEASVEFVVIVVAYGLACHA